MSQDPTEHTVFLYKADKAIYPRAVHGWFATWRWALVWFTQILFYGLPWLQWNGRQFVLFDLISRRFYIGPLVLYPQDFIYLTALLIISAYGLFLFTAVAGRLWCGYACPQTVYTEIFLWVERRFEGDRMARMKRDAGPLTAEKFGRKAGKHLAWATIGLWTGFTFVGYFSPIRELASEALAWTLGPWQTFWIFFYGFATYGNAGFMREQVCKYMCPYARFQSAMFDKDTLIITYDPGRGEPRGAKGRKKGAAKPEGMGDCIDCGLCVQVCPTGIDIRNGLQYECIGCAACVDVCDGVMDKVGYPRGLVRYDTQHGLQQGLTRQQVMRRMLRPRVLIYTAILLAIVTAMLTTLALRTPFRVDVVRDRATLARIVDDGFVENLYRLQLMNADEAEARFTLAVDGLPGIRLAQPMTVTLAPTEARWITVAVQVPPEAAQRAGNGAHEMHFDVTRTDGQQVREKSTFVVPR